MRVILASRSPRRLDLLQRIGISPEVFPANIDETQHSGESVIDYVKRLSQEKAEKIVTTLFSSGACPGDVVVLGADTCVELDGVVHDQPADRAAAERTLKVLSGRTHQVHTAVTCISKRGVRTVVDTSRVTMVAMNPHLLEWYLDTGESFGKAGAYGMQGNGGVLVSRIQGSMSNVVGLPLRQTAQLLRESGVSGPQVAP